MKIIIVNGPNLNLLGEREPDIYGYDSLEQINNWIKNHDSCKNVDIEFFQSNSEGKIIDFLHKKRKEADFCIINAGALTHYSFSLRDAISASQLETIEVHLSDIHSRENFRKTSVIKNVCIGQFFGQGKQSYVAAIEHILEKK